MTIKQIIGIVCFVFAAAFFLGGIVTVSRGPGLADPSGLGISHAVGAFLPSVIALVVGLWLFQKPKKGGDG